MNRIHIIITLTILLLLTSCISNKLNNELKVGVLSDIHGNVENLDYFLNQFEKEKVNIIILNGDLVLNEELRYGRKDKQNDTLELISILKKINQIKTPVYVIPGNHETKESYHQAFNKVDLNENVIDMSSGGEVSIKGITFTFLPGYYTEATETRRFIPKNGFFISEEDIRNKITLETDVIVSHGPPLTNHPNGIDVVSGDHVGSLILRDTILQRGTHGIFGHIHEAKGAISPGTADKIVEENQETFPLWLNSGAVEEGYASIFTLNLENMLARHKPISKHNIIIIEK